MAESLASGVKPEKISSKDESTDKVEHIDFNLKIRCAKTVDGKAKFREIRDIRIDEPDKNSLPAVVSPKPDAPVVKADPAVAEIPTTTVDTVPATPPIAAATRQVPEVKDSECDLCPILADALRQQVAPREQRPRRKVV